MNNNEMGMDDIIYAPNYFGSSNGILDIEEEKEYALDSYMVFDNIEFKTLDDVKHHLINILEMFPKVYYNIYIEKSNKYDGIHILYNKGRVDIIIPHKTSDTQIERELLYKTVTYNSCYFAENQPFKRFDDLIFDFRNIFR